MPARQHTAALNAAPQSARNTLAGYDAKNRYAIYYRLTTAKRPETRAKRIADAEKRKVVMEKYNDEIEAMYA